jgi:oligopeptide/dipeptide ABC transporter ATP-binding protein
MQEAEQQQQTFTSQAIIEFRNVSQYFHDKNGGIVTAVDGVDLSIKYGEVVALVGESGSGKTTLGRLSVGLGKPSKGEILLGGKNLLKFTKQDLRAKAQYIHQDPYSALDPYLSVREVLERPLIHIRGIKDPDRRENVMATMLDGMGLESFYLSKSVRELSGGQKQRILVARAFIVEPAYVVADEPTTMVDFVRRNEIMSLLTNLTRKMGTAVLLITHDVSVASKLSNRVAVMYKGEIVETGNTKEVMENPLHPYTLALLSVTPEKLLNQSGPLLAAAKKGNVSIPLRFEGCRYSFTCPYAYDKCRNERPQLVEVSAGHKVACFKVTG